MLGIAAAAAGFGIVVKAVAGAVIGGAVTGTVAYNTSKKNAKEYQEAANQVRGATEEYSGTKGLEKQTQEAIDNAYDLGMAAGQEAIANQNINTNPGATGGGINSAALVNAQNASDAANRNANAGFSQGAQNAKSISDAKYNAETQKAQQLMKQSDINYNVANQTAQAGLNAAGNILNTAGQIGAGLGLPK